MSIARNLEHLAQEGSEITCTEMTLLAGDHDPPIVAGNGLITVHSSTRFAYRLVGTPDNVAHALESLRRLETDPYDGRLRSRFLATTDRGEKLLGGWTEPRVDVLNDLWTFTSEIEAISLIQEGSFEPGVECVYLLAQAHRARVIFRRFIGDETTGDASVDFEVLGSQIRIELDDERGELRITASASDAMHPTMLENWLGEPLRILFGQPVYPKFVARRSHDRSMNWVRPSPMWNEATDHVALWQGPRQYIDRERFWLAYRCLLTHVARADGFEAHRLTSLYEELMDATNGSRWVWALTYASTAEALIDVLGLSGTPRIDLTDQQRDDLTQEIVAFRKFLKGWDGSAELGETATRAVARLPKTSAAQALRALVALGVVHRDEHAAWETPRNRVMHGHLVSPYSSAKNDKLLLDLAGLCRSLIWHLIDLEPDGTSLRASIGSTGTSPD